MVQGYKKNNQKSQNLAPSLCKICTFSVNSNLHFFYKICTLLCIVYIFIYKTFFEFSQMI